MDMGKIGAFLSELRKEKNLTQNELGEKIGETVLFVTDRKSVV